MRSSSRQTLTGSQGSAGRPRVGVIAGYVFRIIREQQGRTQEEAAEQLRVSADTIAGWESGRRPLTAVPVGQMLVHRHRLMQMGTAPRSCKPWTAPWKRTSFSPMPSTTRPKSRKARSGPG